MNEKELIRKGYEILSGYLNTIYCNQHNDCEGADHNENLNGVSRYTLAIEQVGTKAWSTIASLNAKALEYFMQRLIAFAVSGTADSDRDPFFCHFINSFYR